MTLAIMRAVLVANVVVIGLIGFAYFHWGERPTGIRVAVVLWLAGAGLLTLLRFLRDPP